MPVMHGKAVIDALVASGIVRKEDYVRRVVIDVSVDAAPLIYIERFPDERLLEVLPALTGVEVRTVDKAAADD